MGMFRWGMGGGYGRPFFNAMSPARNYPAVTIAMPARCAAGLGDGVVVAPEAPALARGGGSFVADV